MLVNRTILSSIPGHTFVHVSIKKSIQKCKHFYTLSSQLQILSSVLNGKNSQSVNIPIKLYLLGSKFGGPGRLVLKNFYIMYNFYAFYLCSLRITARLVAAHTLGQREPHYKTYLIRIVTNQDTYIGLA